MHLASRKKNHSVNRHDDDNDWKDKQKNKDWRSKDKNKKKKS